ncbi:hypothetical protein ABAC460_23330 [Asticcacaulis sp. AC460]|uniref:hypothetical protein n=1 Tax=Asticcacaulis sp. AC460 TaxID=1282360 RepID=UPI0003C3B157|nr:hypothetical protein [Asticcacaulis sp. AC460]ESQ86446.1 hypothetical protein ABAC460_23330 [Asticcacaulis sp. AC460]
MEKTEVRFVDGFDDSGWPVPEPAKAAGLNHRFAVIQETYRPDSVDMYFDEPLWFSMVDLAKTVATDVRIGVLEKRKYREVDLEAYLATWSSTPQDDKDPPNFILGRDSTGLNLVIGTEYWCRGGGPEDYHDSYTYAVYSKVRMGVSVMAHLAGANSGGWDLAGESILGIVKPKPPVWQRIWNWLVN